MINDARRAYFYAKQKRIIYIEVPDEEGEVGKDAPAKKAEPKKEDKKAAAKGAPAKGGGKGGGAEA